jgi:cysteine dioxygenase
LSQATLNALCDELSTELSQDPKGTRVAALLASFTERDEEWREFVFFDDAGYTRNLVHRCGEYELLILGWDEGQESPIHCHDSQRCWMAVLEGDMEERHYQEPAPGAEAPLVAGEVRRLGAGRVAFIDDGIALHDIRPAPGTRGISLHLYARPIDSCRVFEPATGGSRLKEVGYYSVRGERCERSAAEVRAEWA